MEVKRWKLIEPGRDEDMCAHYSTQTEAENAAERHPRWIDGLEWVRTDNSSKAALLARGQSAQPPEPLFRIELVPINEGQKGGPSR
ncbi:MAG TPA: hypothetical protein VFC35_02515 [Gemmatimonadaceae bacterium]|nr:hypothetical protein [Gemmatimonadaceae bacterium]